MQEDQIVTRAKTRSEPELREAVEASFSRWFLPLSITATEADQLRGSETGLRTWTGRAGRSMLFMPAPPPVKTDPTARPVRLGQANIRLKELRALSLNDKEALALRVIDGLIAATDRLAVAFSGGRDSLVALHLTRRRLPDVAVVFTNTSVEFPETVSYVRRLAVDWKLNLHELRPKRNFWELTRQRGLPIGGRGNTYFLKDLADAAQVKLSNACCNQLKITPARQFYVRAGIEGVVTGLRTEESLMRRLNFADYGALRWSKDYGALVAWPVFAWKREDIEAYVAKHDLPVNPVYAMGHQRVGCWACLQDFFYEDSRLFVLKQSHPRMYDVLKAQFGDEMLRVLTAWGDVQKYDFTMEHFDGLYSPCGLDLLRPTPRRRRSATPKPEMDAQSPPEV
jgi:phosphoadenosine phosphosulfate reductase